MPSPRGAYRGDTNMADGQIIIETDIDIRKAEAKLQKLNKKINEYKNNLESNSARKSELEQQIERIVARWDAANAKMYKYQHTAGTSAETIRTQNEQIKHIEQEWKRADAELKKLNKDTEHTAELLRSAETEAEDISREVAELNRRSKGIDLNLDAAAEATKRFNKRIAGLMKRVFVFTVITKALRSVKDWFSKVAKTNDELTGALAQVKGSLLTLAQPILNVVIPAFSSLLSVLTKVLSAAASILSVLFGTTAESSADQAENLYEEAEALDAVGGSASKAEKQLASFDTINKLSDSSGGGGGKADSSILPDFSAVKNFKLPSWLEDFLTSLRLTIDDVLFDWGDWNGEKIAEKAIAGLTTLCGAAAGFIIGGVPGAIVGSLLGLVLGLVIDSLTFDHDGQLSKQEIAKMVMLAIGGITAGVLGALTTKTVKGALIGAEVGIALTALINKLTFDDDANLSSAEIKRMIRTVIFGAIGGVAGLALTGGSALGAVVGLIVGVGLSLVISKIELDKRDALLDEYTASEFAQQLDALSAQIEERTELRVDLKARVDSITGTIDDATLANFDLAQQLVSEIFELDAEDNKTAAQVELLIAKVEMLNTLGLGDIGLEYDELTGHVTQTKEEIESTIAALKRQYELEATKEAYIEAYRLHAEAAYNLTTAENELTTARGNAKTAADRYTTAVDSLTEAQGRAAEAENWVSSLQIGSEEWQKWTDKLTEARDDIDYWTRELDLARIACDDANAVLAKSVTNYGELQTAYTVTAEKAEYFGGKVDELVGGLDKQEEAAADGKNVMQGYALGIEEGKAAAQEAIQKASRDILRDERAYNEIASPSGLYKGEGDYLMQGLAEGITENAFRPIDAMKAVLNSLAGLVERGINNIVDKYNSVALAVNAESELTEVRTRALNRVSIPRLAQGAVIPANREFLAVLGDQRSGTNIETPLATMVQAFRQALSEGGYGGQSEAVLEVDGVQFGKLVYKYNRSEGNRIGVNLAGG